jgi:hypothetical protein
MTIEQMVRDLLAKAIQDELVAPNKIWKNPDPQARSSGELVGVANLLRRFLHLQRGPASHRSGPPGGIPEGPVPVR